MFASNRGRVKIGYTMLEVDGFPPDWVREANAMEEVWVPSEFYRRGFLDSGLKRPIYRVPLAVDTDHFHPGIKGRKEPWLLLKVFNDEFSAKEPVRLLCKIVNWDTHVDRGLDRSDNRR